MGSGGGLEHSGPLGEDTQWMGFFFIVTLHTLTDVINNSFAYIQYEI